MTFILGHSGDFIVVRRYNVCYNDLNDTILYWYDYPQEQIGDRHEKCNFT